MKDVSVIGVDLAKSVFFLHGVDGDGRTVFRKKLSRSKMLPFFSTVKPCIVGMEAGGGSNYWAREIRALGHEVRLVAAQFVKPYVKADKTDPNDAAAICETITRPHMRFVPIKSIDQQDLQSVHRIRERLVAARTALACEIRGFLGEYGIVLPIGIRTLKKELPSILSDDSSQLTAFTKELISELSEEMDDLTRRIERINQRIELIHKNHPVSQKLTEIPGVGILSATAIVASVSDPSLFKNGRQFAAYLGLVPKQRSSGGKQRMLGISKRGDRYIRKMLIHGARTTLYRIEHIKNQSQSRIDWAQQLRERRGFCKTTVALANKNARIIWAVMSKDDVYRQVA